MEVIKIDARNDSPSIILDAVSKEFKISGASYPENAVDIYAQVFDWLDNVAVNVKPTLKCDFYFNYLNSASRKIVYEILLKLESIHMKHNNITIVWYYDEFDEDMFDFGEELEELVNIPFDIIAKEE